MPAKLLSMRFSRIFISLLLLAAALALFGWYISGHQYLLARLADTSWQVVGLIILLYFVFFLSLTVIFKATLKLCGIRLAFFENFSLNAYSKLANFFIPGQSGPILRGAYMKKKHKLPVKKYIFATLIYYACYSLISVLMLLIFSVPWWLVGLGIIVVGGISFVVLRLYEKRKRLGNASLDLSPKNLLILFGATLFQAIIQFLIYLVELHSLSSNISLSQVITYTGAANFGLFAALTPGAIGIREAFLLFSERLHHIASGTIITAGVLDRAVFLIYLGLLFAVLLSLHGKRRLSLPKLK